MILPDGKKDKAYNGKWNGVGGKAKKGESPEECAIREIYEETGYVTNDPKLSGILTFPDMSMGVDWCVFVFIVKTFSGYEKASSEGQLKWFTKKEIIGLNLWEADHIFLPLVFKEKFFTGKFTYINGKLQTYKLKHH